MEARFIHKGISGGSNQKLYTAFLDFQRAFDSVPRRRMWRKLHERFGISGKLLRVIMDLFTGITGEAVVNGGLTRVFPISSGVLQGSVLGPLLFLLFIDDLLGKLNDSAGGIAIADSILSVIAYADDVTLLSLKVKKLQRLLDICNNWAINNDMNFSLHKCFVAVFNST